ncbi:MAG: hypothetical protein ACJ71P_15035 [Nitrososphaeraceae archaeon]|jgi:uncharacterized lipoprotein YbaY
MIEEKRTIASSPLIRGKIIFDKNNVKPFLGATVYIRLDDVTMQDAPSKLILQQVIKDLSYDHDDISNHHQKKLEFELFGDIVVDVRRSYAIRVHIDVDNNGKINSGDFINMESYPVITHGYPKDSVLVRVKQVK